MTEIEARDVLTARLDTAGVPSVNEVEPLVLPLLRHLEGDAEATELVLRLAVLAGEITALVVRLGEEIASLKQRRVQRIQTLLRAADGKILGSVTEEL